MQENVQESIETSPKEPIAEFIEELLAEYHEFLPLDVIVKLTVRKWIAEEQKPKEIKNLIRKGESEYFTNFKKDEINDYKNNLQQIFESYNKPDNNKIRRLGKTYPKISDLIYLVGIDKFIDATLNKYPFPLLIGLPYENWTDKRMGEYILFYFEFFTDENEKYKMPSLETIHNSLNRNNCLMSYSLKNILQYFINDTVEYDYFYIHIKNKRYPVSEQDMAHAKKKDRYDHTLFPLIFHIKESPELSPRIYHQSYNRENVSISLDDFFSKLRKLSYKTEKERTDSKTEIKTGSFFQGHQPIFFIEKKWFKLFRKEFKKSLDEIPDYRFIVFDNEEKLMKSLNRLCPKTKLKFLPIGFSKIFAKIKDISKVRLKSRSKISDYKKEIKKILDDFILKDK